MKRLGFVQLEQYGLALSDDGRIRSLRPLVLEDGFGSPVVGWKANDLAAAELGDWSARLFAPPSPKANSHAVPAKTFTRTAVPPPPPPVARAAPTNVPLIAVPPPPPVARAVHTNAPMIAVEAAEVPDEDWDWQIAIAQANAAAAEAEAASEQAAAEHATRAAEHATRAAAQARAAAEARPAVDEAATATHLMSGAEERPSGSTTVIPVPHLPRANGSHRLAPVVRSPSSPRKRFPMGSVPCTSARGLDTGGTYKPQTK